MKKLSADAARAAITRGAAARPQKRKEAPTPAPREKAAVAKRPCAGISIGAPAAAAKVTPARPTEHLKTPSTQPAKGQPVDKGKQPLVATDRGSSRPPTPAGSGSARSCSAAAGNTRASNSPGPGEGCFSRAKPSGKVSVDRRREGGDGIHIARFDLRESALGNAAVARDMMKMILLPRDVEEREKISVGDVLEEVFPHLTHLVHDVAAMRAAVMRYAEMSASLQHKLKEAEDKIAGSDRRIRQLASNEDKLKEEMGKLRKESDGLQSSVAGKDAELAKLRRLVADQSVENEGLQSLRELAEKKAQAAEDKARAAESRALSAENDRELAIATAVSRAVEEYKSSAAFEQDASDACSDFYKFGYADCLGKAADQFPGLDIARLALPDGDQEEGELPGSGHSGEEAAQGSAQEPVIIESPEKVPAKE